MLLCKIKLLKLALNTPIHFFTVSHSQRRRSDEFKKYGGVAKSRALVKLLTQHAEETGKRGLGILFHRNIDVCNNSGEIVMKLGEEATRPIHHDITVTKVSHSFAHHLNSVDT